MCLLNGEQCSPRRAPLWPRSAASQWATPPLLPFPSGHPSAHSSSAQHQALITPLVPPPSSAPSPSFPPLAPQISSSRLNRLFYFIPLSSEEQHRPAPSVSFSPQPPAHKRRCVLWSAQKRSQPSPVMFLIKFSPSFTPLFFF